MRAANLQPPFPFSLTNTRTPQIAYAYSRNPSRPSGCAYLPNAIMGYAYVTLVSAFPKTNVITFAFHCNRFCLPLYSHFSFIYILPFPYVYLFKKNLSDLHYSSGLSHKKLKGTFIPKLLIKL